MNKILGTILLPLVIFFQTSVALASTCSVNECTSSNYNEDYTTHGEDCTCVMHSDRVIVSDSNEEEYSFIDTAIRFVFLGLPIFFGLAIIKNIINGGDSKSGK